MVVGGVILCSPELAQPRTALPDRGNGHTGQPTAKGRPRSPHPAAGTARCRRNRPARTTGNSSSSAREVKTRLDPGYGTIPDSVRALRLGASDFIEKPCDPNRLQMVLEAAAHRAHAQRRRWAPRSLRRRSSCPGSLLLPPHSRRNGKRWTFRSLRPQVAICGRWCGVDSSARTSTTVFQIELLPLRKEDIRARVSLFVEELTPRPASG